MKKIIINVGERLLSGKHVISTSYSRTETINVLRNMAWLLEKEYVGKITLKKGTK